MSRSQTRLRTASPRGHSSGPMCSAQRSQLNRESGWQTIHCNTLADCISKGQFVKRCSGGAVHLNVLPWGRWWIGSAALAPRVPGRSLSPSRSVACHSGLPVRNPPFFGRQARRAGTSCSMMDGSAHPTGRTCSGRVSAVFDESGPGSAAIVENALYLGRGWDEGVVGRAGQGVWGSGGGRCG